MRTNNEPSTAYALQTVGGRVESAHAKDSTLPQVTLIIQSEAHYHNVWWTPKMPNPR